MTRLIHVLVAVALFIVLVLEFAWYAGDQGVVARAPGQVMTPGQTSVGERPVGQFSAVVERSLFSPERRAPARLARAPGQRLPLTLHGIVITDTARVVLVSSNTNPDIQTIQEGASFEGWIVETITENQAIFTRGTSRAAVALDDEVGSVRH